MYSDHEIKSLVQEAARPFTGIHEETSRDTGEIERELDELVERLQVSEKLLSVLRHRLAPVLDGRPDDRKNTPELVPTSSRPVSTLGMRLAETKFQVIQQCEQIDRLIALICL